MMSDAAGALMCSSSTFRLGLRSHNTDCGAPLHEPPGTSLQVLGTQGAAAGVCFGRATGQIELDPVALRCMERGLMEGAQVAVGVSDGGSGGARGTEAQAASSGPDYDYPVDAMATMYTLSGSVPAPPPCCYKRKVGRLYVCMERPGRDGVPLLLCMIGPCWPMVLVTTALIIGPSGRRRCCSVCSVWCSAPVGPVGAACICDVCRWLAPRRAGRSVLPLLQRHTLGP